MNAIHGVRKQDNYQEILAKMKAIASQRLQTFKIFSWCAHINVKNKMH